MGAEPRPYSPEYGASAQARMLEDSGETSFSNRNALFRFDEEEPPSDTKFSQYYGSAKTERATCVPTRSPGAPLPTFAAKRK